VLSAYPLHLKASNHITKPSAGRFPKPLGPTRSAACVFPRASAKWGGPLGVFPHSRATGHSVPAGSKLYNILRTRRRPLGFSFTHHPGHNFMGGGGRGVRIWRIDVPACIWQGSDTSSPVSDPGSSPGGGIAVDIIRAVIY